MGFGKFTAIAGVGSGPGAQVTGAKSFAGTRAGAFFDPMDLLGYQADFALKRARDAQEAALAAQERAQKDAYERQIMQQKPYYDAGVNALSQLSTPGTIPLSAQYGRDMEQGSRALNRSLAASGQFRSSNAYDKFGQFYNQLGGEEMGRQYNNALAPVKIGQMAMGGMGAASDTFGAGMSSAYNNYGNQNAQNSLLYGQRRADSYTNTANAIGQGINYFGSR